MKKANKMRFKSFSIFSLWKTKRQKEKKTKCENRWKYPFYMQSENPNEHRTKSLKSLVFKTKQTFSIEERLFLLIVQSMLNLFSSKFHDIKLNYKTNINQFVNTSSSLH